MQKVKHYFYPGLALIGLSGTGPRIATGCVCNSRFLMLFTGIHPTTISESFEKAAAKAVEILTNMATPVALSDRESLLKSAMTSLSSKVSEVGNKKLSLR